MTLIPSTTTRVQRSTPRHVNAHIRRSTARNIVRLRHAPPERLLRRLSALDREWDIERTLEANAAGRPPSSQ